MLDEFLPRYDVNEVHSVSTSAAPAAVMDAIRALTAKEVPLLVALMAIRSVPALLRRPPAARARPAAGRLSPRAASWMLREAPDELVLGQRRPLLAARPAACAGSRPPTSRGFAEPGFAKAAFNFEIERVGERTVLRTETRVATTDEHARRSFARYWRVVHPGSALIRIAWLRAIRRRAERHSA